MVNPCAIKFPFKLCTDDPSPAGILFKLNTKKRLYILFFSFNALASATVAIVFFVTKRVVVYLSYFSCFY